ncbi:hypothetical protein DIPPA_02272 [Diplonema papillatum]|nr:hypothetical protein DIPPA_02272 [Diplonema papillatum]
MHTESAIAAYEKARHRIFELKRASLDAGGSSNRPDVYRAHLLEEQLAGKGGLRGSATRRAVKGARNAAVRQREESRRESSGGGGGGGAAQDGCDEKDNRACGGARSWVRVKGGVAASGELSRKNASSSGGGGGGGGGGVGRHCDSAGCDKGTRLSGGARSWVRVKGGVAASGELSRKNASSSGGGGGGGKVRNREEAGHASQRLSAEPPTVATYGSGSQDHSREQKVQNGKEAGRASQGVHAVDGTHTSDLQIHSLEQRVQNGREAGGASQQFHAVDGTHTSEDHSREQKGQIEEAGRASQRFHAVVDLQNQNGEETGHAPQRLSAEPVIAHGTDSHDHAREQNVQNGEEASHASRLPQAVASDLLNHSREQPVLNGEEAGRAPQRLSAEPVIAHGTDSHDHAREQNVQNGEEASHASRLPQAVASDLLNHSREQPVLNGEEAGHASQLSRAVDVTHASDLQNHSRGQTVQSGEEAGPASQRLSRKPVAAQDGSSQQNRAPSEGPLPRSRKPTIAPQAGLKGDYGGSRSLPSTVDRKAQVAARKTQANADDPPQQGAGSCGGAAGLPLSVSDYECWKSVFSAALGEGGLTRGDIRAVAAELAADSPPAGRPAHPANPLQGDAASPLAGKAAGHHAQASSSQPGDAVSGRLGAAMSAARGGCRPSRVLSCFPGEIPPAGGSPLLRCAGVHPAVVAAQADDAELLSFPEFLCAVNPGLASSDAALLEGAYGGLEATHRCPVLPPGSGAGGSAWAHSAEALGVLGALFGSLLPARGRAGPPLSLAAKRSLSAAVRRHRLPLRRCRLADVAAAYAAAPPSWPTRAAPESDPNSGHPKSHPLPPFAPGHALAPPSCLSHVSEALKSHPLARFASSAEPGHALAPPSCLSRVPGPLKSHPRTPFASAAEPVLGEASLQARGDQGFESTREAGADPMDSLLLESPGRVPNPRAVLTLDDLLPLIDGSSVSPEYLADLLVAADCDKDGCLSFEEFCGLFTPPTVTGKQPSLDVTLAWDE